MRLSSQTFGPIPTPCVAYNCSTPPDYTFQNGAVLSTIGLSDFTNKVVKLEGSFTIDINANFNCCTFITNSGDIVINQNVSLGLNSCFFYCGSMGSIKALGNNRLFVQNNYFSYFNNAFEIENPELLSIYNNTFFIGVNGLKISNANSATMANCLIYSNYFYSNEYGIKAINCSSLVIGSYSLNSNSFEECVQGIESINSYLFAYKNKFIGCDLGVSQTNMFANIDGGSSSTNGINFESCDVGISSTLGSTFITKNSFFSSPIGIKLENNLNCTADYNNYYMGFVSGGGPAFDTKQFLSSNKSNDVTVQANVSEITSGGFHYFVDGPTNFKMKNNELNGGASASSVNFSDCTIDNVNLINQGFFNFENNIRVKMFDNIFNREGGGGATFLLSSNNRICSNQFLDINLGLSFDNPCNNTLMGLNTFTSTDGASQGLVLRNADIGTQRHMGNCWMNSVAVLNAGDKNKSLFFVNANANQCFLPSTPNSPSGWFNNQSGNVGNCSRSFDGLLNETEENFLNSNYNIIGLQNWQQVSNLLIKILENPVLLNNPTVSSFYNFYNNSDIFYSANTRYLIGRAISNSFQPSLDSFQRSLVEIMDSISNLNLQLSQGGDTMLITQQKAVLATLYSQIKGDLSVIINLQNAYFSSQLNLAGVYCNLIQGNSIFTQYYKEVLGFVIESMLDPEWIPSVSQMSLIMQVANLCVDDYGEQVLYARNMLSIGEREIIEASNPCNQQPIQLQNSNFNAAKSINILSSITTSDLLLDGLIEKETYVIFNALGQQVQSGRASKVIPVSNLTKGYYFITISVEKENTIKNFKFTKI